MNRLDPVSIIVVFFISLTISLMQQTLTKLDRCWRYKRIWLFYIAAHFLFQFSLKVDEFLEFAPAQTQLNQSFHVQSTDNINKMQEDKHLKFLL